MEILDPDLWNDDGTPKKPSQEYMKRLEENPVFQQFTEGLAKIAESTTEVIATGEVVQGDVGFFSYARIRREAKAARSPETGDIVHFWDGEQCRAAIVMETSSFSDDATMRVHIPHKPFEDWTSEHDEDKDLAGTYHWPCGEGQ